LFPTLAGFSRAMFSNWLWHKPLGLVVDAGEGLQLALGTRIWAVDLVVLTHGHSDHVLGLPGFVASRRYGKGATEKPLTIVYPDGSNGAEAVRDMFARLWPRETFPVEWVAAADGYERPVGKNRVLHAFASKHGTADPTLGYRVIEARRRLKPEFSDRPQDDIRELVQRLGREAVMEEYRHVVFAHSGDSMPVDVDLVRGADLVVHDATFLEPGDRRWDIHASSREVLEMARQAGVRCLVLQHLSIRYERQDALPRLREQVAASGFAGDCWLLDDSRLIALAPEKASPGG
jgi:ribonuclease Z